eukprot:3174725-Pyramimonas_sp.AAC.1
MLACAVPTDVGVDCLSWTQTLREKAEFRNPDEFYFAMQKAGTKGGVHIAKCVWFSLNFCSKFCTVYSMCENTFSGLTKLPLCSPYSQPDPDKYTEEQMKLLKSQDMKYVNLKAQVEAKANLFLVGETEIREDEALVMGARFRLAVAFPSQVNRHVKTSK